MAEKQAAQAAQESFDPTLFENQDAFQEAASFFNKGQEEAIKGRPEGTFQAIIQKADVGRASSGRLQCEYALELMSGASKGSVLMKYDGLQSEKTVEIALGQLSRLGVDIKKVNLNNLRATVKSLENLLVQIMCKQNGEFYNIYFQKVLKKVQPGTTSPGANAKF